MELPDFTTSDLDLLAQQVEDAEQQAAWALRSAAYRAKLAADAEHAYETAKDWQSYALRECHPLRGPAKRTMLDAGDRFRELRAAASAAQERSVALTAYARLLRRQLAVQALLHLKRTHGAELDRLIGPALAIVRPHFLAGSQVPLGEILLDARWGIRGRLHGPTPHWSALDHTVYRYTHWIAAPGFEAALMPLYGYPMHLHRPLMAAVLFTLELQHGRVAMIEPDLDPYVGDSDARLAAAKLRLHEGETAARPPVDEDDDTGGRYGWQGRLVALAEAEGYVTHPDAMSRLDLWLHGDLARRPWWWPRGLPFLRGALES